MCNKLAKVNFEQWNGFKGDRWKEKIDVRNFISMNYTPYDGDASFLEEPTEATDKLWGKLQELQKEERAKGGVLDMETEVVTGITAYGPGYIDEELKDLEQVVGLPVSYTHLRDEAERNRVCALETFVWNSEFLYI